MLRLITPADVRSSLKSIASGSEPVIPMRSLVAYLLTTEVAKPPARKRVNSDSFVRFARQLHSLSDTRTIA